MAVAGRSVGAIGAVQFCSLQTKKPAGRISRRKVAATKKNPKQFTHLGFGSLLPQSGFCSWAAGVGGWGAAQRGLITAASSNTPGLFQCGILTAPAPGVPERRRSPMHCRRQREKPRPRGVRQSRTLHWSSGPEFVPLRAHSSRPAIQTKRRRNVTPLTRQSNRRPKLIRGDDPLVTNAEMFG